jgi:hypothetical protein
MQSLRESIQSELLNTRAKIRPWLEKLSADESADLHEALADQSLTTAVIWRALKKRNVMVSQSTLERYRQQIGNS